MKKLMFVLLILSLALTACGGILAEEPEALPVAVQSTPTAYPVQPTYTPLPTQVVAPVDPTPMPPTLIPPTAMADDSVPSGQCVEDSLAVTNFTDREVATVDEVPVQVQSRGSCPQPLFYDPTGVEQGQNYMLHLPEGWSALTASVTVAVHPDDGKQDDYLDCPFLVIQGPFDGSVGLYEGAIRIVTSEWEQGLVDQVLPIHSAQCGHSVTPTIITGE